MTQTLLSAAAMSLAFGLLVWALMRAERREQRQRAAAARSYQRLGVVQGHKRATRFENPEEY